MRQIILLGIVVLALLALIGFLMTKNNAPKLSIVTQPTPTLVPSNIPTEYPTATPTNQPSSSNLANTINNESSISLFNKDLQNVKLNDLLTTSDQYTVFAPTNETMQKINANNYSSDQLNNILKSYIGYGNISTSASNFLSVNGQKTSLSGLNLVKTIKSSNGTLYVINNVLTQ